MNKTPIEWTDYTWNPVRARLKGQGPKVRSGTFCTRISPGCTNCYASTINRRFGTGMAYTVPNLAEHEFFIDERILAEPLKLHKPSRIFAGDMNDIFHESIETPLIDKCIAIAALSPKHTFQFLTKRADRMQAYFSDRDTAYRVQRQIDCITVDKEMSSVREEYRAIPDYEGHYEVSNYGNIRSKTGRQVSPIDDHHGYLKVALSKEAIVHQFLVHRLVLAAFVGPSEQECRHRNGAGTDNRIANLRYCEHAENVADRSRHGQSGVWMKEEAPLSDAEVEQIRKRRASGELLKSIEADTGVDRRKVSQIALGKTYKLAALDWPLPNIWLGVSVEDQQRADERIPLLLQTAAAVRFLSVEPLLEAVNLVSVDGGGGYFFNCLADRVPFGHYEYKTGIDWVICGGESGPGARPFNLAWAESLHAQCRAAGTPFFMKQLGSKPFLRREQGPTETKLPGGSMRFASLVYESSIPLRDRKGGDPAEWPEHLRVREFPASQKAEAVPA